MAQHTIMSVTKSTLIGKQIYVIYTTPCLKVLVISTRLCSSCMKVAFNDGQEPSFKVMNTIIIIVIIIITSLFILGIKTTLNKLHIYKMSLTNFFPVSSFFRGCKRKSRESN